VAEGSKPELISGILDESEEIPETLWSVPDGTQPRRQKERCGRIGYPYFEVGIERWLFFNKSESSVVLNTSPIFL